MFDSAKEVWISVLLAVVVLGIILILHRMFPPQIPEPAPPESQPTWKVTLYSGGEVVREWVADEGERPIMHDWGSFFHVDDKRVRVQGTVVIEEVSQ